MYFKNGATIPLSLSLPDRRLLRPPRKEDGRLPPAIERTPSRWLTHRDFGRYSAPASRPIVYARRFLRQYRLLIAAIFSFHFIFLLLFFLFFNFAEKLHDPAAVLMHSGGHVEDRENEEECRQQQQQVVALLAERAYAALDTRDCANAISFSPSGSETFPSGLRLLYLLFPGRDRVARSSGRWMGEGMDFIYLFIRLFIGIITNEV